MLVIIRKRKKKRKMKRSGKRKERHGVYVVPFKEANASMVMHANFLMMNRYEFFFYN